MRQCLIRLLGTGVTDYEIATALDMPVATYSRRKDKPDFPTFDELRQIAEHFGVEEAILQIDFGHLDPANLNAELQQRYAEYRNAIAALASMRR